MPRSNRIRRHTAALFAFFTLFGPIACKSQSIEKGKSVRMDYTLTVDGNVVDTSIGKQPLSYVQGSGQIMPGLEEQLVGLKAGDKKHVSLAPEKGYGPINPKAQQKVPIKAFGDSSKLKVGMTVTGQSAGRSVQAKVLEIGKKDVTLDFNHPLAGKTLVFDITVVEVKAGPPASASAPAPEAMPHP